MKKLLNIVHRQSVKKLKHRQTHVTYKNVMAQINIKQSKLFMFPTPYVASSFTASTSMNSYVWKGCSH